MGVLESFNIAIAEVLKTGEITEKKQGPIIEAARKVAALMDDPEWPIVRGKIDNVSPSVFLKYCEKLGIAPDIEAKKGEVVQLKAVSKWKRA